MVFTLRITSNFPSSSNYYHIYVTIIKFVNLDVSDHVTVYLMLHVCWNLQSNPLQLTRSDNTRTRREILEPRPPVSLLLRIKVRPYS